MNTQRSWRLAVALLLSPSAVLCLLLVGISAAAEPANRDLTAEARNVVDYLESIYGKKVLSGICGERHLEDVHTFSGKYPAMVTIDLNGEKHPTWGDVYRQNVQHSIDRAKEWWQAGGIVTMQLHWKNPMNPRGTAWVGPPQGTGPLDIGKAITPSTDEYRAVMADLEKHADYLQQLLDARVPVLWRPFHEIDGGWFWWTDAEKPENTAALWRLMYDYFVHQRKLNNLIWVYSAAVKPSGKDKDVVRIEYRRRFYPGDAYVDISGIDIYRNDRLGWGSFRDDTYPKAFDIMSQVTPHKMLALCECAGIPDPDKMAQDGPRWLF
jgi:mannan endo-1,4-beta-mannosidase